MAETGWPKRNRMARETPPTLQQQVTAEKVLRHGAEYEVNGRFLSCYDLQALVALIDRLKQNNR